MEEITKAFRLKQNWPNPFNSTTIISYFLPGAVYTKLKVYDMLSREVGTLVDAYQRAGWYQFFWNGTDERGQPVPSGTYFYTLQAGEFQENKCMTLLR